jgi:hypothetical protein
MISDCSPCSDSDSRSASLDVAGLSIPMLLRSDALANAVRRVVQDLSAETYAAFGNAPAAPACGAEGSAGRRLDVALGPLAPAGVERLGMLGPEDVGERVDS